MRSSPTPLPPSRTIAGALTGLGKPVGLDVDLAAGEIIASNLNASSVRVFPLSGSGNIAPTRIIQGAATGLASSNQLVALGAIPSGLRFKDQAQIVRGATSVAVRTFP